MLSVSQAPGSPAVSLVYTVRNGTVLLNGTTASNVLGQLSAELVGYFLFYPPLIIAERKLKLCILQEVFQQPHGVDLLSKANVGLSAFACLPEIKNISPVVLDLWTKGHIKRYID